MTSAPKNDPVGDTVPQVNNELAVGEDIEFQRKWWIFESIAWGVLVAILVLDVLGAFGRGYLAHAEARANDGSIDVKYDRIERFQTPSILTVRLEPSAVENGKVHLWTSESLVTHLGNQRVIPQPVASMIGNGGTLYTFEATRNPTEVEFALEPSKPGAYQLELGVRGLDVLKMNIFVMP